MDVFDDMPPLVDANPQPNIPPPPGATIMPPGHLTPHSAHAGWNPTVTQARIPFPSQAAAQDPWVRSHNWQTAPAPQPPAIPSPYIPHATFPQTWDNAQQGPIRRTNSFSAAHQPNPQQQALAWNAWGPSPFQYYARPLLYSFPTYPSASLHTPASAMSVPRTLSGSYVPPDWPGEPPKNWRRDFRFKPRLISLFRSKSAPRFIEESTDSARLCPAPVLQFFRSYPPVILDLRRDPKTLVFRALDRHVFATDLMQSTTVPPTRFMRVYHTRLPWYIDIVPSGGSYVTLGDFFTAVCQALALRIRSADYYNDELDDEDREVLRQAWDERCRDEGERMDGVKRVDFLREKYMFQGLSRGKSGMWQLRTGRE